MKNRIRFWHYGTEPVLITIHAGETLRHSSGGATDEGWSRTSNVWHFDGEILTNEWCDDGVDCDGRLTQGGHCFCRACDVRAGYAEPDCSGVVFPAWQPGKSYQRDYAAEAAGY